MIIAGADNRPPMLEKSLYDSWKSPDDTTRTKKYEELSATEKIQADYDCKATNIILQGIPPDVYAIVKHHKVAKEIWDRVKLLMQGTKLSLQEKECKFQDGLRGLGPKGNYLVHVSNDNLDHHAQEVEYVDQKGISKSVNGLENQLNHKVRIIRCDNGTKFKNYIMNEFYAKKRIKREFSVARTPQQNGRAERKNKTLIEAARTMLADSLLPIQFWAEAVNTTCYVLNRVLVTKPQNKTPYELLIGKPPSISFMRPFGCPLTILNTLDPLGKFDGKADEGYLLGYSTTSKAFRVYNKRTKRVEENLHIDFLEDQPNMAGTGTQDFNVAGSSGKTNESTQEYILLPLHPHVPRISQEKPSENASKDKKVLVLEDVVESEEQHQMSDAEQALQNELEKMVAQEVAAQAVDDATRQAFKEEKRKNASTSTVRPFVSTANSNHITASPLPDGNADDSVLIPNEGIFNRAYDDEDVGAEADFNNMDNTINVSPIPTLRIHKVHPKDQILGDPTSAVQTRGKIQKASSAQQALKVWVLDDFPYGKKVIGTKWVFRNKRDARSIIVKNKAWLVAQGFRQEEGIDYDEVFASVARIEAIRLFLAFASYMGFTVYQMDVKSAFLYGTIEEEVYVHQPPGFVDHAHPNKVYKVIKALSGLNQAPRAWYDTLSSFLMENGFRRGTIDKTLFIKKKKSDIMLVQVSMGELTFFLGLQVKQQPDGIFISQNKYVADILKKFDFLSIRTTTTLIESNKPLVKNEDGVDVGIHVYMSMIGSLMYLTASRPDIMFAVYACARFKVTPKASHLNAVKRIFRYLKHQPKLGLWYPRDSPFELEAFSDSDYGGASLDRKSTTGGCQFLGRRLISWQCKKQTIVANSTTEAEYVAAANCCGQVLWIQNQVMDYGFNFMNTKIHIDNESTISVIKNPVAHSRTKHIEIRFHFIRDCYEKRLIEVIKIHIDFNVVDLLTKGFDVTRFNFLVVSIGMLNFSIYYALTVSPIVSTSFVEQFWMSAKYRTVNNISYIDAIVASKPVTISEASIRSDLLFHDVDGIDSLNNQAIFHNIQLMGPSPSIDIPNSNPEGSSGNHGGQSSNDTSLLGKEDGLILQSVNKLKKGVKPLIIHHKAWMKSVALKTRLARKTSLKKKGVQKGYVSKQGRKSVKYFKNEPSVHKDPNFEDLDDFVDVDDTLDYTETEDDQNEGRTSFVVLKENESVDKEVSTEALVSLVKPNKGTNKKNEGTDKQDGCIDSTKVSTDRQGEGIADQNEGKCVTQITPITTSTPTPSIFGDDETIAQIDLKDKGKKMVKEEGESDTESDDITEAKKKFKMLDKDEEVAKKVQKEWEAKEEKKRLAEEEATKVALTNEYDFIQARINADKILAEELQKEEREKFTIEQRAKFLHDTIAAQRKFLAQQRSEAIRNKPPTRNQLRNQMMTYLKHVGGKKHSDLKTKTFEEIQVLYERLKRQDQNFVAIGSAEDERQIKELNKDPKKKRVIKETPRKEDTAKGDLKIIMESLTEENDQCDFWNNQQEWEIVRWRLYEACGVCILKLKDVTVIYMLVKRRHKNWLVHNQMAYGKDFSNPFMVDNLPKIIGFSNHHASHAPCYGNKALVQKQTAFELAIPEQTTTGNGISNPLMAGSLSKTIKPT
ncbi:putative ribonuclease H-like domain-containing protein [Tanacetum coccineum]